MKLKPCPWHPDKVPEFTTFIGLIHLGCTVGTCPAFCGITENVNNSRGTQQKTKAEAKRLLTERWNNR